MLMFHESNGAPENSPKRHHRDVEDIQVQPDKNEHLIVIGLQHERPGPVGMIKNTSIFGTMSKVSPSQKETTQKYHVQKTQFDKSS